MNNLYHISFKKRQVIDVNNMQSDHSLVYFGVQLGTILGFPFLCYVNNMKF